jgi:hypothetical protein
MVAEGGGGYPLGGPERAFVTRHLQQSSAGRPDLAIASMLRCSRLDACCDPGPQTSLCCARPPHQNDVCGCTNSVLMYLLPRLEILPRIVRSPVDSCFGTADVYATTLCSLPRCSGSNLPRIREDRSTLPIENQSFVSSGDGVFIPAFSFPGFDSIPGVILAKHRPKFPTALRGLLAKPLLKQDR